MTLDGRGAAVARIAHSWGEFKVVAAEDRARKIAKSFYGKVTVPSWTCASGRPVKVVLSRPEANGARRNAVVHRFGSRTCIVFIKDSRFLISLAAICAAAIVPALAGDAAHRAEPNSTKSCNSSKPCIQYNNAGTGTGITGSTASTLGTGVLGYTTSSSGYASGVSGDSSSSGGIGVYGNAAGGTGVYGNATSGVGVYGVSTGTLGGVFGATANVNGAGVDGTNISAGGVGIAGVATGGGSSSGYAEGVIGVLRTRRPRVKRSWASWARQAFPIIQP